MTKTCRNCREEKALAEFHRRTRNPDGLSYYCKACWAVRGRAYYKANRLEVREKQNAYTERNRERHREQVREWRRENPEKRMAQHRKYVAARASAGVPVLGSRQWHAERLEILERDDGACGVCGGDVDPLAFTLDHIIPTDAGGVHEVHNLQLAHPVCNSSKGRRMPWDEHGNGPDVVWTGVAA